MQVYWIPSQSNAYNFLLVSHSNWGPITHHFQGTRFWQPRLQWTLNPRPWILARKHEWSLYHSVKTVCSYPEPFWCGPWVWQMDRDRQTDRTATAIAASYDTMKLQHTLHLFWSSKNTKFKPAKLLCNSQCQNNVKRSQNTAKYQPNLQYSCIVSVTKTC